MGKESNAKKESTSMFHEISMQTKQVNFEVMQGNPSKQELIKNFSLKLETKF